MDLKKISDTFWVVFCKIFGHACLVRGRHSAKAYYDGKPWPFKYNYVIHTCPRCGWTDKKQEPIDIEEIWREGMRNKRSLI
jgi:hypothetical protein